MKEIKNIAESTKMWLFDLDGTLIDSMDYKAEAFFLAILKEYPQAHRKRDRIIDIYHNTAGIPRKIQLYIVLYELGYPFPSESYYQKWIDNFTKFYHDGKEAIVIEGAVKLLEMLQSKGKILILSTVAPEKEAREVLSRLQLNKYFEDVLGHSNNEYTKGKGHIDMLQKKYKVKSEEITYVGDSPKDISIAYHNNINAVYIKNKRMKNKSEKDLKDTVTYNNVSELYDKLKTLI